MLKIFYSFLVLMCANNLYVYSISESEHTVGVESTSNCDGQLLQYTNITFSHGESPVWDQSKQLIYFVDVLQHNVHALNYNTKTLRTKHIGYGEVNVVTPVANSSRVLVAVRNGLYLLDWSIQGDSALRNFATLDQLQPTNVINEGKADVNGRFWAGTKGPQDGDNVTPDEAALYSVEQPTFCPQVQLKPVSISNGLVWSLNNTVLYYIDSSTKRIDAFDFNSKRGHISNRRTIVDIQGYGFDAIPDGMTIDREGFLWVALMFNGSIIRINPDAGTIIKRYQLPVTRVSSMAWYGEELQHMAVTSSRRNLNETELAAQPLAGCLFFLYNLHPGGVPDHEFVFADADTL